MINYLLSLRPCQLNTYINHLKVLKKYNKLSQSHILTHQDVLTEIFKDTPYPFRWDLHYDVFEKNNTIYQQEMLAEEKKILFKFQMKQIHFYEKNIK